MAKRFKAWVLHDNTSGYLKHMTCIGPACTQNIEKARVFSTREEAERNRPKFNFSHFFQPVEVWAEWVEVEG